MKFSLRKSFALCLLACIGTIVYKFTALRETSKTLHGINTKQMKYILQWTSPRASPFSNMGHGQEVFLKRNCLYVNCFVTHNKVNVTKFDVIAFAGPELSDDMSLSGLTLPEARSAHQKYVFASIESAYNYQIHTNFFDGYFNWTWTYKLDSDLRWGYIVVRDMQNNIIGPEINMNWLSLNEMDPITEELRAKLGGKSRIAAWIVSNCYSESKREQFFEELQSILEGTYNQSIDVYGDCGFHVCREQEMCNKLISEKYYFYLSFENSLCEDYVTEKLLLALKNEAVPIVYGGANYTRFMPDGIYLNAIELGVANLAKKMIELMKDPAKYADYFKWKNHYKYESTTDSPETDEYCKMCAILNDEEKVNKTIVYWNFMDWWNPKNLQTTSRFNFRQSLFQ